MWAGFSLDFFGQHSGMSVAIHDSSSSSSHGYRALARQYRPLKFADLVGQSFLVETLTQCLVKQRIPQAFLFHGIRGVGKTTVARILARALNCEARAPQDPEPCGSCSSCVAISEDRHFDVIEMDAASHTGVDDIREVIEAARYKPVQGRFKIYIIDEIHMLSKSAFNALLKTLEEPPLQVKFIFATTEVRKIPDTILSRSMRFDLQRIEPGAIVERLRKIAALEAVPLGEEALILLSKAADGSLRDGVSLLDQAIALSQGEIDGALVRSMLGLVDRVPLFQLLHGLFEGDLGAALHLHRELYQKGADPRMLLAELLDLVYTVTTLQTAPSLEVTSLMPENERVACQRLAQSLSLPTLMRAWQVLLKGQEEVAKASSSFQALEMLLIRLGYLQDLPSLNELLGMANYAHPQRPERQERPAMAERPAMPERPTMQENQSSHALPQSFEALVEWVIEAREPLLGAYLQNDVALVSYEVGKITLRCRPGPQQEIVALRRLLREKTGQEWVVQPIETEEAGVTLADQKRQIQADLERQSLEDPTVQSILNAFPGAKASLIQE